MKKIYFFSLAVSLFLSINLSAALRRVYLKVVSDNQAWSFVTQDSLNIVKTVGVGGDYTYFTDIDFNSTGLKLAGKDEIWLAKGSYAFNKQLPTITNGVLIYGGFYGSETAVSQRAKSDVDGNGIVEPWEFTNSSKFVGLGNSSTTSQSYRMMVLNSGKVIDGVTVSDVYYSNPTGTSYAAGCELSSNAVMRNSIIRNISTISTSNSGVNGGGLYINRGHVEGCLIENCTSDVQSAANTATVNGGGVLLNGSATDSTSLCTGYFINSVVRNCTAGSLTGAKTSYGGGVYANTGARVENCVIYNNSALCNSSLTGSSQAGGIFGGTGGDAYKKGVYFVNLTVVNNYSNGYSGFFPLSDYASAYNCIVWHNATGGTAAAPTYTTSAIRISTTTGLTGYPYLDYVFHNTDATTSIYGSTNNKATSFIAYTSKVVLNGNDNSKYPAFLRPTTFVGSSSVDADIAAITTANWILQAKSPLVNKGIDKPTNTVKTSLQPQSPSVTAADVYAFATTDLIGVARGVNYQLGAYQTISASTAVQNITADNKLSVYQVNGVVQVQGIDGIAVVKLNSVSGSLISSTTISSTSTGILLSQHGVYIVSVSWNNQTEVHKIVF